MPKLEQHVVELVDELRAPRDQAWHSLVDFGRSALPYLVALYREHDTSKRELILTVINECESQESLRFLGEAVADANEKIWKTALDGLVRIGGDDALEYLATAELAADRRKRKWIDEARHQILEKRT